MAIPLTRYVLITSSVGVGNGADNRELIGRFFTENTLVPTNSVVEFSSAADVGVYFGTDSDEYARAVFYFGWISKSNTSANLISFARWASSAVGSTIYGKVATYAVGDFTGVSTGDFTLTLAGDTEHLTGINLTAAASLSDVAAAIQTKIRANSGGGAAWTGATVTYNSTRKSFDFVSGDTGDDVIAVTAGVTTDVASLLGWLTGAILSNGVAEQSITTVLTNTTDVTNNFGSFTFVPSLTLDEVTEAAEWNATYNNMFLYSVAVSAANASAWSAALDAINGVTLTLSETADEYPEQVPMMLMAATNYSNPNSVQNYMFQQFDLTPSVTSSSDADDYDELLINYYGQTQQAGTNISFYQRGVMMGTATSPRDQNVYANEVWLKDAAQVALMNLLLIVSQLPYNAQGRSQVLTIIQGVVNQALANGTISVGKPLTSEQILYITTTTNDPLAWQQVQNIGYWLDAQLITENNENKIVYTLLYSKDDVIRFIEGRDILI